MTGTAGYNSAHPIGDCVSTEFPVPPADSLSYTFCANGTSYAAPLVAGVAGLMETLDDSLTPLEHQRILQEDRKGGVEGKRWVGRVDQGGRRVVKKQKTSE